MSIRVVARIRPLLNSEIEKDVITSADGNFVKIPNPKNESEEFSFAFNKAYDQGTPQEELFTAEGTTPHPPLNSTIAAGDGC